MIHIAVSHSDAANEGLQELAREQGESNTDWLRRAAGMLDESMHMPALLIGGVSTADFRLRMSQSHARTDMEPSDWSHIALLNVSHDDPAASTVYEISLNPPGGFGFPPVCNAVQTTQFRHYESARRYPNIALLHLPVDPGKVSKALDRFKMQRTALDTVELVVAWLGFLWGVGSTPNPLLSGLGMPCASMVEAVVSYAGFELTPGMPSRSSCPEAVWQSARWWHNYYSNQDKTPITGRWCIDHEYIHKELDGSGE